MKAIIANTWSNDDNVFVKSILVHSNELLKNILQAKAIVEENQYLIHCVDLSTELMQNIQIFNILYFFDATIPTSIHPDAELVNQLDNLLQEFLEDDQERIVFAEISPITLLLIQNCSLIKKDTNVKLSVFQGGIQFSIFSTSYIESVDISIEDLTVLQTIAPEILI